MSDRNEYELRFKAIQLHQAGIGFNDILRRVQRSCFWLTKWLRRYREHGAAGLCDQSRAPKHVPNRTRRPLVRKILALRDELVAHKTSRAAFAGIGAETIHFELHRQGKRRLPSISTIEKILARAGKTKRVKARRPPGGPPYPYVPARKTAFPKSSGSISCWASSFSSFRRESPDATPPWKALTASGRNASFAIPAPIFVPCAEQAGASFSITISANPVELSTWPIDVLTVTN